MCRKGEDGVMDVITYSLMGYQNSDIYYSDVAGYTDKIIIEGKKAFNSVITDAHLYFAESQLQQLITPEEEVLELLILGVLWRVYCHQAIKPPQSSGEPHQYRTKYNGDIQQLDKLISWLETTGEFKREVVGMKKWQLYISTISYNRCLHIINSILSFAEWFELDSEKVLGKYTHNVDNHVAMNSKKIKFEDMVFCRRRRVEYHLNMIGAEIMNRAFRHEFLYTKNKVILLPICMTSPKYKGCLSRSFGRGFQCESCSENCQVNQLVKLENKWNFKVMVIPHQSSISAYNQEEPLFLENTGVIGVACVLNLISGGWALKDMGVPAQCVLLDYCGCKAHWHHEGFSTSINVNTLESILKKQYKL